MEATKSPYNHTHTHTRTHTHTHTHTIRKNVVASGRDEEEADNETNHSQPLEQPETAGEECRMELLSSNELGNETS